jgi:hypothetical protein
MISGNTIDSFNKGAVSMKKIPMFLTVMLLSILVVGCKSTDDNATNVSKNAPMSESGENEPTEADQSGDNNYSAVRDPENIPFPFSEFDLEVEYRGNQSFKVEYENEKDGAEASVENDLKNQKIEGNEAYAELEPLFKKLTFTSQSKDEEVKKEILSVFNITEEYEKIDLDIKFADGIEKDYTFKP